ncbi:MAG: transporter substrate-binding domain-containing protein [Xanthobacteraceae bacterium]|nr:transporter substrate-binding domain-containing protein [Xanthobacteraceae bacterium]
MRRHCVALILASIACTCLAFAQGDTGAARRLAPSGELRAALIASNPVLVTRLTNGELGGVSVELARALGARFGVTVRLIPYENPARYNQSLGKGEWDIGLAARDPSRAEHLAFSEVFMEVDNSYVARPGSPLKKAEDVDRAGIKVAVAQGSAPDAFLTRTLKYAEIVRVPGGLGPAREALVTGRADVYGENAHLAHRIATDLSGASVLEGRFNVVHMSIAVPKERADALDAVNQFVREVKRNGDVARAIERAGLRGVRSAP